MRVAPGEYLSLRLRAHELLRDVPLYDVSVVDLPGGGSGRTIADIRALETRPAPSRVAKALFGVRFSLGRLFGWDRKRIRPEESPLPQLSEQDRRKSQVAPGTPNGLFLLIYQFPDEALAEIRNATVHGWLCTALVPCASGYRLYLAVYVRPLFLAHAAVPDGDRAVSVDPVLGHAAPHPACLARGFQLTGTPPA